MTTLRDRWLAWLGFLMLVAAMAWGAIDARAQVVSDNHTVVVVPQQDTTFRWATFTDLINNADAGENVAITGFAHKYGRGPTWAGQFLVQDFAGDGAAWGIELDAMAAPGGRPLAYGLGIVVGRAVDLVNERPPMPPARVDSAIAVLPYWWDRGHVDVNYGLRIDVPCAVACIKLPGGSAIQMDDGNGDALLRFDPQTGYMGFWRQQLCVWCVNMTNGAILRMVQF